jgi:hypothetical protein
MNGSYRERERFEIDNERFLSRQERTCTIIDSHQERERFEIDNERFLSRKENFEIENERSNYILIGKGFIPVAKQYDPVV